MDNQPYKEREKYMSEFDEIKNKLNKHDGDISDLKISMALNTQITQTNNEVTKELSSTLKEISGTMCQLCGDMKNATNDMNEIKDDFRGLRKQVEEMQEKGKFDIMTWIKSNFIWIAIMVTLGIVYLQKLF
ncbi:MAG: hypothetical protein ACRCTZ_21080 [Sarcina sp.]